MKRSGKTNTTPVVAQDKKDATIAKWEKKLAVLKRWTREGMPENYEPLRFSLSGFGEWEDASLGVEKIGYTTIHNKEYSKNKTKAEELLNELKASAKKVKSKDEVGDLKRDLKDEKDLTQDLTNQVHKYRR